MALDQCSKLHFAQYLLNKCMDFDQLLCNHMYLTSLSADILCKQFEPRSGPTECQA